MDWGATLLKAVRTVPQAFAPGVLGYLTATSKVEGPVRDAVASHLHRELSPDGHFVAREWRRRDLAILGPDGAALVLLEAKALYGFDVVSDAKRRNFLVGTSFGLGKDMASLLPHINAGGSCFLLTVVTHPMAAIPNPKHGVIAYASAFNAALRKAGSAEALLQATDRWADDLRVHGQLAGSVRHDLGEVYGVPFLLDCHLVGPLLPRR